MKIIFVQTSSGESPYREMIAASAELHKSFCREHGLIYRVSTGVLRGFHPWQATFNRVEILGRLLERRFRGWLIFLDADAVIVQPEFQIRHYLKCRSDRALVIAPGGEEAWNVNAGVFFINLQHELGRQIARRWRGFVHEVVSEPMLRASVTPWELPDGRSFPHDQHLLQLLLADNPGLLEAVCVERSSFMNYQDGRFIRQIVRAEGSPEQRLEQVRHLAEQAMQGWSARPATKDTIAPTPRLSLRRVTRLMHRLAGSAGRRPSTTRFTD